MFMDAPTTSITFTMDDQANKPGTPVLTSAVAVRLRTVVLIVLIAVACVGLSAGNVQKVSSLYFYSWMSPMDQAYYTCMRMLDIPVTIGTPKPDYQTQVSLSNATTIVWRDPYGGGASIMSSSGTFGYVFAAIDNPVDFNAFVRVTDMISGPILIVDGVDYSSKYEMCLTQSGYAALITQYQQTQIDLYDAARLESPQAFRDQVSANNAWVACARSQGWLIPDSTMPPMGAITTPQARIPAEITDDQLRALLSQCPVFDPDKQRRIDEWANSHDGSLAEYPYPEDFSLAPAIGFSLSPFDAVYLPVLLTDEGRPLFDRLMSLYKILYEQQTTYADAL